MTDRELMQQALEALEFYYDQHGEESDAKVITALRERLAQPEQEPVALETIYDTIICWDETDGKRSRRELARRIFALYTTPPRREWVGLMDDDLKPVCDDYRILFGGWVHDFARAIEAKLKEKNA